MKGDEVEVCARTGEAGGWSAEQRDFKRVGYVSLVSPGEPAWGLATRTLDSAR